VTIVPVTNPPPTPQEMINGQVQGKYDITACDYVTYIDDQLGASGAPKADLRIIAEASFLQPDVLTVMVKGGSPVTQVGQLKNRVVSVNAPNNIGSILIDSLLAAYGLTTRQVHYSYVSFPAVAPTLLNSRSGVTASFAPEPFVSLGEAKFGLQELADLDQGSTQNFPIQGYGVTAAWAKKYPNTLKAFTTALSQGQQIADTDRAAVETAIEQYLAIPKETAAFISLPTFPLGVNSVRLQRVVNSMVRFGLLPKGTKFHVSSMIEG
jgi:NitT/TauT family transport system substrate-binding protein